MCTSLCRKLGDTGTDHAQAAAVQRAYHLKPLYPASPRPYAMPGLGRRRPSCRRRPRSRSPFAAPLPCLPPGPRLTKSHKTPPKPRATPPRRATRTPYTLCPQRTCARAPATPSVTPASFGAGEDRRRPRTRHRAGAAPLPIPRPSPAHPRRLAPQAARAAAQIQGPRPTAAAKHPLHAMQSHPRAGTDKVW